VSQNEALSCLCIVGSPFQARKCLVNSGKSKMRYIESYIHCNRIGAMLEIEIGGGITIATNEISQLATELAMQIVATNPAGIDSEGAMRFLTPTIKPNSNQEGIPLLTQRLVKDSKITVGEHIQNVAHSLKVSINVVRYVRFSVDDY
jgi:translation elongation factor EF-Ts